MIERETKLQGGRLVYVVLRFDEDDEATVDSVWTSDYDSDERRKAIRAVGNKVRVERAMLE